MFEGDLVISTSAVINSCYSVTLGGFQKVKKDPTAQMDPIEVLSVSQTILREFIETVEKEEDLREFVPRLRKLILEDSNLAEASVRSALFPEAS